MPREIFYTFNASAPPADPTVNSTKYTTPLTYPVGGGYYKAIAREEGVVTAVTSKSFERSPTDYLVYYPFSGNSLDASGNGYNLTNNGASLSTDKSGNPDSAYSFNGLSNYMETANGIALTTKQVSICFNIKAEQIATDGILFELSTNYNGNNAFIVVINNSVISFANASASNKYNLSNTSAINNQWNKVCIVSDRSLSGTQQTTFYINGVKTTTVNTINENVDTVYGQYILRAGGRATVACFNGIVDDIKIFNRAVTEAEAIQLTTE